MSAYPEHDRQALVVEQTQAIGEFLDWLESQGVQLIRYREDLKDFRPTDPGCAVKLNSDSPGACDQIGDIGDGDDVKPRAWWRRHCFHWQNHIDILDEEDGGLPGGDARPGRCCRCGLDREHEITTRGWVHEQRGTLQLLADWAGIDLAKIEAEKRQMLAAIRVANEEASRG